RADYKLFEVCGLTVTIQLLSVARQTDGRSELPSLAKEGWLRGSRESCEATLSRADGVVRSSHRLSFRKLNEPPRPRLSKEAAIYLVARPPLLCQGGESACTHGVKRVHT